MDHSNQSVLIVDSGRHVELGVRLSRDFGEVLYWSPWQDDFPTPFKQAAGRNRQSIERCQELFEGVKRADLIVFPTNGYASYTTYLRESGKRVFGAGTGELLEMDRLAFKRWLEDNELPCVPYEVVIGVDALHDYMLTHPDTYVKLPQNMRGAAETFKNARWPLSEARYNDLRNMLGPLGKDMTFICEEHIEGFETGTDRFTIDGQYPVHGLLGHEIKDKVYVGKVVDHYPEAVALPDEYLKEYFLSHNYRGLYSTEVRVTKEGIGYFIDFTGRFPSPPGEAEEEAIKNLADLLWFGADGQLVEPDYEKPFVAQLNIECEWGDAHWLAIDVPKKSKRFVKMIQATEYDGLFWLAPEHIGNLRQITTVGLGSTVQEAIHSAVEVADSLTSAESLDYSEDTLEDALEHIEKAKAFGISWD